MLVGGEPSNGGRRLDLRRTSSNDNNSEYLPQPGDSLFKLNPSGDVNADLSFLKSDMFDFLYASGFKRAGDAIIQQFEDTHEWYKEPELFMPAMYSYRHFVELTLKWQIKGGAGWKFVAPTDNEMRSHDLLRLWNLAKPIIQKVCRTRANRGVLGAVERIIKELHMIDQSGQTHLLPLQRHEGQPHARARARHSQSRSYSRDDAKGLRVFQRTG